MNLPPPQFFDIFGSLAFIFIVAVSGYVLYTGKRLPKVIVIALFLVGLLGLLVDVGFVYSFYLK